jgi:hypothetical protein
MVHAPTTTSSKNEIWFDSQNFNICTESQLYKKTYIALFFTTSSIYISKEHVKKMPMKFQNINLMTTLSTLTNTFTMSKTIALDLDIVA